MKFLIKSSEEMIELGKVIAQKAYPNLVIALDGDLGSGKTTLTKGIGMAFGINKVINSPTFTIMKVYDIKPNPNKIEKLYHLDVYRLTDSHSDFELEEYFYMNGLTVIEWANIIADLLPSDTLHITIQYATDTTRIIEINSNNTSLLDKIRGENYEIIN